MVGSPACPLGVDASMTHAEDSTNTAIFAARLMKGMSIVETRFRKTGWAGRRDRPLLLLHIVVHLLPGLLAPLHSHRLLRMEASSEFGGAWQQPACAASALGVVGLAEWSSRTASDKDEARKGSNDE